MRETGEVSLRRIVVVPSFKTGKKRARERRRDPEEERLGIFRKQKTARPRPARQGNADGAVAHGRGEPIERARRASFVKGNAEDFGGIRHPINMRLAAEDAAVARERSIEDPVAERQAAVGQIEPNARSLLQGAIKPEHAAFFLR